MGPVGGEEDEGEELAGDFVDDDKAGVFAATLAGDDGGGGDADERGKYGGYGGADGEGEGRWMEGVGVGEPEQQGGDGAVGPGTGLQQARAEEGADGPRPRGSSLRRADGAGFWSWPLLPFARIGMAVGVGAGELFKGGRGLEWGS